MSNKNKKSQLEKIEQSENRLKARKQKLINSMKSDKRKQDTRMKILLGSYLLKQAFDHPNKQDVVRRIVGQFSERDQVVFDSLFELWPQQ